MDVLKVEELAVDIHTPRGCVNAVRGISLNIGPRETLCLVGESGCGKSVTALALMGLLPQRTQRRAKTLNFAGRDLNIVSESAMRDIRGNDIAMIFQEPMTCLNPSLSIGTQLMEGYLRHRKSSVAEARDRALFLMNRVGIPKPEHRLGQYPHQLSGGLRQRVMIAMALMCSPRLIIADEPTTALDVTIQAQILELLRDLQSEFGMAILLITHDLGVVAHIADRVAIMYAGEVIEEGATSSVLGKPSHPYTKGLLDCVPIPGKLKPGQHLGYIPGKVPSLIGGFKGCAFRNRCRHATPACRESVPMVHGSATDHYYRCILPPTAYRSIEAT